MSIRRSIIKPILDRVMPPIWSWYVRKPRRARWRSIRIQVPIGVFHPSLFLSTRFLLQHLEHQPLAGKSLLELGAGSGLIAIAAAKQGAIATATDISRLAIAVIPANAAKNDVTIQVIQSDLFASIPKQSFDWIVINPPYYPRDAKSEAEYAWFCGEDFGYFKRLFAGLGKYVNHANGELNVRMVLSEDCAIDTIAGIANAAGWELRELERRQRWGEWNYLFAISLK